LLFRLSQEASVDSYDWDTSTPVAEAMTTTLPPFEKLNISDVAWLTPEALHNGTVELDVNGQKKQLTILPNPDTVSNISIRESTSLTFRTTFRCSDILT